jgi:hypothetical protein
MIQLLPVTEPSTVEKLNQIYHTKAQFAYVCVEKKEIKASCLYSIESGRGVILNVSTMEEDIFDGLVRAVFASLIDQGINEAVFDQKTDKSLLEKLNFVQDDTFFVNSLTEIIHNCRKCQNA